MLWVCLCDSGQDAEICHCCSEKLSLQAYAQCHICPSAILSQKLAGAGPEGRGSVVTTAPPFGCVARINSQQKVWLEPLLWQGPRAQGVSTAAAACLLLSPAAEFREGQIAAPWASESWESRISGRTLPQSAEELRAHCSCSAPTACADQAVSSELTARAWQSQSCKSALLCPIFRSA